MGEEIRVSGPAPALGSSNPERAVSMVTSPGEYPWWTTKESVFLPVPEDRSSVQYRYCVFSGGSFVRWEGDGKLMRGLEPRKAEKLSTSRVTCDYLDVPPSPEEAGSPASPVASAFSPRALDSVSQRSRQFATWGKRSSQNTTITSKDRVVVVSYFLPVNLTKGEDGQWNASWNQENILALKLDQNIHGGTDKVCWVGTVRHNGAPIPVEEEMAVSHLLAAMNCFPVFITQIMHHQFYEIFCKQHLWLLLHHIADVYGPMNQQDIGAKGQQDLWFAYSTVNRLFRDKVVEIFQKGDLVWIHGFHLMLLPSFLRRFLTVAKIGYFFHTPFPSSEIWRTMTRREDLLRGILAADQVGFHLYEYARHFMTTCHRLLGHGSDMSPNGNLSISVDDREVVISCIHVGIDLPRLRGIMQEDAFPSRVQLWSKKFPDKRIVASVDRLERLKGIPLKLKAIDLFLSKNPNWLGKIAFTLIGISAIERGDDYRITQTEVAAGVKDINSKYGKTASTEGPVVWYEERHERNFGLKSRLEYFAAADILMVTATRDGLNRFPLEFTIARNRMGQLALQERGISTADLKPDAPVGNGLVVISEFISSARVMRGALTVNPWRLEDIAHSLQVALCMPEKESKDRFRRNMEFSTRLTVSSWASQVLRDLKGTEKVTDASECMVLGFGMGYKVMNIRPGFQAADPVMLSKAWRVARSRLVVLDWGGTLTSDDDKSDKLQAYALATGQAERLGPSKELTDILETLSTDARNYIFVVSGKELLAVSEYFGGVKHLGLGAEHGFYYRWPRDEKVVPADTHSSSTRERELKSKWQTLSEVGDQTWKASAKLVMKIFTQRTHGTYIEQKGNALIWQFRDADPEFGFLQSKELEEHLKEVLTDHKEVEIIRGGGVADGYIEVRPAGVSKGRFLEHAYLTLKRIGKAADFVLAIGDDTSDEPMFEQISRMTSDETDLSAFGITVGKKPSAASSYLDDPNEVMELLSTLGRSAQRDNRYYSAVDLRNMDVRGSKDSTNPGSVSLAAPVTEMATNRDPFATNMALPPVRNRTITPESRAMSMGNLSLSGSGTKPARAGAAMLRTNSSAHLTMSDYLESINDNDEEDETGIFF